MQEMKGYKELIKQENMSSYNPADGELRNYPTESDMRNPEAC